MSTIIGRKSCLKFCLKVPAPRNVIADAFNAGLSISEAFDSLKTIYGTSQACAESFRRSSKTSGMVEIGWTRESRIVSPGSKELRKTSMKSMALFLMMTTE
ncbi:Hypothetical protein FKW44_002680 [Caligus rogercresseyi]|uniref:Uncharacterized protein n=1 Tax=Caligus rogercresseyi TaxID=217165 RepID=A0A7T8KKH8_CALRO|nr:Hypothetical protein FKW44_002680 [Caligus rogercresseyi]